MQSQSQGPNKLGPQPPNPEFNPCAISLVAVTNSKSSNEYHLEYESWSIEMVLEISLSQMNYAWHLIYTYSLSVFHVLSNVNNTNRILKRKAK